MSPPSGVVIVGGGFTGAVVAAGLARGLPPWAPPVVVVEPRAALGQGLAYSTGDPAHRINVPAAKMTMDTARRDDLQRWIDEGRIALSPESEGPDGALYPQRGIVARYVADRIAPLLRIGRILHVRGTAVAGSRPDDFRIALDDGAVLRAGRLVIATGHPPPSVPAAFAGLEGDARLLRDPFDADRVAELARGTGHVLVVGMGLTAADVIASLDRQGFAGRITALSRRGVRSRGHASGHPESPADFAARAETTALGLLRRVRAAVRADVRDGLPWQAALDRARQQGPAIWAALPRGERARFLRRLRVWWDVHRFRVAPQVEATLDRLAEAGLLRFAAGTLLGARAEARGVDVTWRPRGGAVRVDRFDAVVIATGPDQGAAVHDAPFLASLAREGLVRPDPLGLGLDVTGGFLAVGRSGAPSPGLLVAGPLARGHVGELMGIPEVTAHAESAVAHLLAEQQALAPA